MMKELMLLLIAALNAPARDCKYLLVQLEETSDEGIEGLLNELPAVTKHQGKQEIRKWDPVVKYPFHI